MTNTLDALEHAQEVRSACDQARHKGHQPTGGHKYPSQEGVYRCYCANQGCEGVLIVDTDPAERTRQGDMTRRACPIDLERS